MRILIVEDDSGFSKLMTKYLAEVGECEVVPNGKQALDVFRKSFREQYPIDLICLDIMMPQMNGHETLQSIREVEKREGVPMGQGVKILMVSALSDMSNIMKSFLELCDGYMTKPLGRVELMEKLEEIGLFGENKN